MNRKLFLTVCESDAGKSLETYLTRRLWISHNLLVRLKAACGVTVNGGPVYMNYKLCPGDCIYLEIPAGGKPDSEEESMIVPQNLGVPILYEDEDFCIYNKPAGMPVHPSYCHPDGTLSNFFLYDHPDCVCRTITRLDSGTSGCVLMAKHMLSGAVQRHSITRIYYGVTDGRVEDAEMRIDLPIAREIPGEQKRVVRAEDGKAAVTHVRKVGTYKGKTLLRFRLETGRTHQIRVHCAHMGFPLCGDALYGGCCDEIARPALHAAYLSLKNNVTGGRIGVSAKLPEDMRLLLQDGGHE